MNKIIENALRNERKRQEENIELIASENYVSNDIKKLQGSILTNKYAEGYPDHRYYGGCEYVDIFEKKAIEYACKLFNAKYANVQPHSGSSANMAVYRALLNNRDKVLGLNLSHGGHLTHGSKVNFSGIDYDSVFYNLNEHTEKLDYDIIEEVAMREKPKMIIAGFSAYSGKIDFKRFRSICDKCGAYLMVDMAHIAGLVATGFHPSPVGYADVVTSTTHKTLRGPRGGIILTNNKEIINKINKVVFPGIQGGPLMHVIAAKAECFYEVLQPSFKEYIKNVIDNACELSNTLKENGFKIISGGTSNHLMLVDVKSIGITGKEAEEVLEKINITCNKNTIPNETESPRVTSGIRLGTPAMTTRGFTKEDFHEVGLIISEALKNKDNEEVLSKLRCRVLKLTSEHPLYE